jgi:hypothetical protein
MKRISYGNVAFAMLVLDCYEKSLLYCDAWIPGNKVPVKRIISIGQPDGNVVPDTLIFPRRGDEEMRIKVQNFAFEFSGSSSSSTTAMSGSVASPEYVEAELMDETFPQTGDFLLKQAEQYSSPSERQLSQAHKIQQAYQEWCEYYGKTPDKNRLAIFTANFLAVKDFHERTGKPLIMNQYSDMTADEWERMNQTTGPSIPADTDTNASVSSMAVRPPTNQDDNEHMRKAYKQWCQFFKKSETGKGLQAYIHNFIAVERYHKQTNKALVLNEFADMTEPEYQEYMRTRAHFVESSDDKLGHEKAPYTASPARQESSGDHSFSYLHEAANGDAFASSSLHSTMKEIVSALHSTVSALNDVAKSLNQQNLPIVSPPSSQEPQQSSEQPLDSLVMDVLKKQDNNIVDLEESVTGLRDVQEQSGELIQLVSQNQMQMAEMMTSVQEEITLMQKDLTASKRESKALSERVQRLESVLSQLKGISSNSGNALTHVSGAAGVKSSEEMYYSLDQANKSRITIQPNPIGLGMSMFTPKQQNSTHYDSHTLENKRRPV